MYLYDELMFNKKGYEMKVNYDIRIMQTYILLRNGKVHNIYLNVDMLRRDHKRLSEQGQELEIIEKVIEF